MKPDPNPELLTLRELTIGYREPLVSGITASVRRGECVVLLGSNGIGKSTLLRTILREIPPLEGSIKLLGRDAKSYTRSQMARTIALVTAGSQPAGRINLWELVALGRQPHTGFLGRLSAADRRVVDESIEAVGLSHLAAREVQQLSDGERQKALIARALAQDTPFLILDEPFSFLDPAARIDIFTLLRDRAREKGTGVLLTSHDVAQALRLSDRLWLMSPDGFTDTTPAQALRSDIMRNLFAAKRAEFSPEIGDFIVSK